MDVAILLHSNGMVLKSASYSGTVMTKCLIRDNFFLDQSYEIVQKPKQDKNDPIFDFCIPAKEKIIIKKLLRLSKKYSNKK